MFTYYQRKVSFVRHRRRGTKHDQGILECEIAEVDVGRMRKLVAEDAANGHPIGLLQLCRRNNYLCPLERTWNCALVSGNSILRLKTAHLLHSTCGLDGAYILLSRFRLKSARALH